MTAPVSVTRLAGYRNETPYPFCPGCGHGSILDRLNEALVALGKDPGEIVLVSDIGCSGLSDQYFDTHAFHGRICRPYCAVSMLRSRKSQ